MQSWKKICESAYMKEPCDGEPCNCFYVGEKKNHLSIVNPGIKNTTHPTVNSFSKTSG